MHAVVLGAGIIGCATAWRLAQAGVRVTVLERTLPGAEASSAAAGILGAQTENDGPGPLLDLSLASRALWPRFAHDLQASSGIDVQHLAHGVLEVEWQHPEGGDLLPARAAWMQALGLRAELLDAAQVHAMGARVHRLMKRWLWLPDDGQVDPRLVMQALVTALARLHVDIRTNAAVKGLELAQGRVTGVRLAGEVVNADAVVVATGAWTDLLGDLPARRTTVQPLHGQVVLLDCGAPPCLPTLMLRAGLDQAPLVYLVPRADGRVLLGATSDDQGFTKSATVRGLMDLLSQARAMLPELADARVLDHWSGLRPRSGDGLPLLGAHREVEGLIFATGHHRNGILLTPISADVTVNAVLGLRQRVDLTPFLP